MPNRANGSDKNPFNEIQVIIYLESGAKIVEKYGGLPYLEKNRI